MPDTGNHHRNPNLKPKRRNALEVPPEYSKSAPNELIVAMPYEGLVRKTVGDLASGVSVLGSERSDGLGLVRIVVGGRLTPDFAEKFRRWYPARKPLDISDTVGAIIEAVKCTIADRAGGWTPTMGRNRTLGHLTATDGRVNRERKDGVGGVGKDLELTDDGWPVQRNEIPSHDGKWTPRVGIGDTAIWPHPWLDGASITSMGRRNRVPGSGRSGHATFISGLILAHAPDSELWINEVLNGEGVGSSWDVAKALMDFNSVDHQGPVDIINLSFACYTADAEPPLALATAIDRLHPDIVVVAGAGNYADRTDLVESSGRRIDLSTAPAWPAALDDVVAVGANYSGTNLRAEFSPRAPWVDIRAPGDSVLSTYPGEAIGRPQINWARWSGTSFATAIITGLIAAEIAQQGGSAREAWERVRERAPMRPRAGHGRPGFLPFVIAPPAEPA